MIERANAGPPSSVRSISPILLRMRAIGSSAPITPVEATIISPVPTPACASASWVISSASSTPCSPTEQFAQPLLATTPLAVDEGTRVLVTVTEGDSILFLLNVPATVAGRSDTSTPRSRTPSPAVLSPANTPPARYPLGEVTDPPSTILTPAAIRSSSGS